jgi:DNA-binding MarR family transcriptional regulator
VPRLDAERVALLRALTAATTAVSRQIDAELSAEFDLPLAWFEVMTALQRAGGTLRVNELRASLDEIASSLSRRLDRMEEAGYIAREAAAHSSQSAADRRAVSVTLTRNGRSLWRDANIAYRRAVQRHFNDVVTDSDVVALQRFVSKLGRA